MGPACGQRALTPDLDSMASQPLPLQSWPLASSLYFRHPLGLWTFGSFLERPMWGSWCLKCFTLSCVLRDSVSRFTGSPSPRMLPGPQDKLCELLDRLAAPRARPPPPHILGHLPELVLPRSYSVAQKAGPSRLLVLSLQRAFIPWRPLAIVSHSCSLTCPELKPR